MRQELVLVYLQKLTDKPINTFDSLLCETRLLKNLWLELIFNPKLVKICEEKIENLVVKDALTQALSWYLAFRRVFKNNFPLEELKEKNLIEPFVVKGNIYRRYYRAFVKSIYSLDLL